MKLPIRSWSVLKEVSRSSADNIAEKIAKLIEAESQPFETAALFAAIEKINHRLDKLENATLPIAPSDTRSSHPSLDKLSIAEAIADSIFGSQFKEKACQFEPSKPCDHCSMCNSRGF